MLRRHSEGKRLFVLDTNVLMHDPTAIFRFQEHDIYLPMVVLEELDRGKNGLSEVARNARQASRFMDELVSGAGPSWRRFRVNGSGPARSFDGCWKQHEGHVVTIVGAGGRSVAAFER